MTSDVFSRFNRETVLLFMGVLGTVVFAALVVAFQERQKTKQSRRDLLPCTNSAAMGTSLHSVAQD